MHLSYPRANAKTRSITTLALAARLLGVCQSVSAQAVHATPDTGRGRPGPLFTVRDAAIAAGFAVGTVAAFPLDKRVARHLQNAGAHTNSFFKNAANGLEVFASPGAYIIGGSMYAVGRLGGFGRLADLGWHGTEAVLVGDAVTLLLKGALGRSRPYVSADTSPGDFKFLGGFTHSDRQSFPSGHATTAFAAAAAVTSETSDWWPRSTWIIGPVMYGGATLVGLSRMYHNKHWASDVALGAAIGTFSGQKVVQFTHAHPRNMFDRVLLDTSLAPDGRGGMIVAWSGTW